MRGLAAIAGIVFALACGGAGAQDARTLKIAGLSLGASAENLGKRLAGHGFGAVPAVTDPAALQREAARPHHKTTFRRRDGHTISVGVAREGAPVVRALDYGIGRDIDTYELIRKHLRGLFGNPKAVHGSQNSVRVAIWEIEGTEMSAKGRLTTTIALVRDPVQGHSLTVRELFKRPQFQGDSASRPSASQRGSTSPD